MTSIVAIAGPSIRRRLLSAFPSAHFCASWAEIEPAIVDDDHSILFVDPTVSSFSVDRVVQFRDRYPALAIVIYTMLNPAPMQHVVALSRAGISECVFFGFDDAPERLRRLVENCESARKSAEIIFEPWLKQLAPPLQRAVIEMCRHPKAFRSTLDLAAAAGISPRATFRQLRAVGFRSARRLVASARVLRAYELLRGSERSVQDVAARLGYRSVDQLSRHVNELAGCSASDIKKGHCPLDFARAVLRLVVVPELMQASEEVVLGD